jgi:hypothetical protein
MFMFFLTGRYSKVHYSLKNSIVLLHLLRLQSAPLTVYIQPSVSALATGTSSYYSYFSLPFSCSIMQAQSIPFYRSISCWLHVATPRPGDASWQVAPNARFSRFSNPNFPIWTCQHRFHQSEPWSNVQEFLYLSFSSDFLTALAPSYPTIPMDPKSFSLCNSLQSQSHPFRSRRPHCICLLSDKARRYGTNIQ